MAGDIPICLHCGRYVFPGENHIHGPMEFNVAFNSIFKPYPYSDLNLFISGSFLSHSGKDLNWKIDCDALTDSEIDVLAERISKKKLFSEVYGIPTGGTRIAKALEKYINSEGGLLIVDDVLTTGTSMEAAREQFGRLDTSGVVIFARNDCPDWIQPIFTFNSYFNL